MMAIRPKTLGASICPVAAGSGLAVRDGVFSLGPASAALAVGLFVQIATNLGNDYFDFVKGGDTPERIGPVRVTQAGLLPKETVLAGMCLALFLAALPGLYLVSIGGWPIFLAGVASLAVAVAYTGGPLPLAYVGLGDLFSLLFFGLAAVAGTYYVQAGTISLGAIILSAGAGAIVTAILIVNNVRDRMTDAAAGKRTLAVRLGDRFSILQYHGCLAVAALAPLAGVVGMDWTPYVLLSLLGVAACAPASLRIRRAAQDRRALNPALEATARGALLYGVLLFAGFALGAR